MVEAQLGIEDVQVDADTGLVTDVLDTVIFTGLVDDGLRFFNLLGRTADVEVGLLDLELDRFTGLLFRFPGDEEVLFGLVDFGLGSAAIIEIIGYASCYLPASLIGIDAGKVLSAQSLPPVMATVGLLPASAMSILRSASWTAMAAWSTSGRYFMRSPSLPEGKYYRYRKAADGRPG